MTINSEDWNVKLHSAECDRRDIYDLILLETGKSVPLKPINYVLALSA